MNVSQLEGLTVRQLMAFSFLVEQSREGSDLAGRLANGSELVNQWQEAERRFQRLVRHYPDQAEEKHYLLATLDAVQGLDPYSLEADELKERWLPLINQLLSLTSS